jgi:hypothetical protein
MKTKTEIIILLIVIWQSLLAAGLLAGITFNIISSGLSSFPFYFKIDPISILNIIQGMCLFGYIPVAIVGTIGLLQRRNYGRIFSIVSMALLILAVCTHFAQNLWAFYLSEILADGSNIMLLAFACINVLPIIYLDRLKIDRYTAGSVDNLKS